MFIVETQPQHPPQANQTQNLLLKISTNNNNNNNNTNKIVNIEYTVYRVTEYTVMELQQQIV